MRINGFDKDSFDIINLAAKYPSIKRVGIFGSYARGDNDCGSDLDLIYDYDEEHQNSTDELLDFIEEVDVLLKQSFNVLKVDYVWYKGVLMSDNAEFRESVLNDVIWIYNGV